MTGVPFHETRAGRRFYEHTAPDIARQLAALVEAVNRLAEAVGGERNEIHEPETPPDEAEPTEGADR